MRTLLHHYWLLTVLLLAACQLPGGTAPQNATESVYVAGWTLTAATNSVADLHDQGKLKNDNYTQAKNILAEARALYNAAKAYLDQGNMKGAQGQILLAQQLLTNLAGYLTAQGIKSWAPSPSSKEF
jgi:hypothetical protein